MEYAHPLVKVTIVPRGKALGAAWYLPEERSLNTYEQMLDEMCSALGGRAAEEIVCGQISTGALNDLEKVTRQAYAMVSYFGMSKEIGNMSFFDSSGQNEYAFTKPYSEKTAQLIDSEVSRIIEEQYERAKKILRDNSEKHRQLAELLLEKEVIFSEDLEQLFGKRKVSDHVIQDENNNKNEVESIEDTTKKKKAEDSTKDEKQEKTEATSISKKEKETKDEETKESSSK